MPQNQVSEHVTDRETDALRLGNLRREQILERLWQIANLNPEMTRGSMTAQIKALSMIVAIEGLIPNSRADKKSTSAPDNPQIYAAAWLANQQEKDEPGLAQPEPDLSSAADAPGAPTAPDAPPLASAPDPRAPFSKKRNPFRRRR